MPHTPIPVSPARCSSRGRALENQGKRVIVAGMAAATGPNGLTEKQEAFALAFLETGNAAEAYRRSYDVAENARDGWVYVEACLLLDNPKIAKRLTELREQAERLSIFNLAQAMDELEEAREIARVSINPSAMVAATTGKIKLFGLDKPAKIEHTGANGGPIQTEDQSAALLLKAHLDAIASRTTGKPE